MIIKPLLDRTHTPRGACKEITLERNYINKRWLHKSQTLEEFNHEESKKLISKIKLLS